MTRGLTSLSDRLAAFPRLGLTSRLVMLTRPMAVDQTRTMTPHSQGKVDGWAWASNGMGYSLVGSLPSEALHPLADDIRKQVQGEA